MTSSWPRCATRVADEQVTEDLAALAARSGRDDLDVTIAVSANRRRHGPLSTSTDLSMLRLR